MELAFADESGIHQGAPVCVVAGYLASPEEWGSFDQRWLASLASAGVDHFHATQFFNRRPGRGIYGHLKHDVAATLLSELLSCVEDFSLFPFGAATDLDAFGALTYGERRFATGGLFDGHRFQTAGAPSKPYFLGFQHSLVEVSKRTELGTTVNFLFSNQEQYRVRALETFYEAKVTMVAGERERIGECAFWDSKKASPLQAADLLSHLWYCYASRGDAMGQERLEAMDRITIKGTTMKQYNREGFEVFFGGLPKEIHAQIRAIQEPNAA